MRLPLTLNRMTLTTFTTKITLVRVRKARQKLLGKAKAKTHKKYNVPSRTMTVTKGIEDFVSLR